MPTRTAISYRTFRTGGSTNVFKYSDAEVDKLLDEGRTTLDPAKRKAIYADLQKRLACDGPIAHLAYGQLFTAVRDGVHRLRDRGNRSTRSLRQTALQEDARPAASRSSGSRGSGAAGAALVPGLPRKPGMQGRNPARVRW